MSMNRTSEVVLTASSGIAITDGTLEMVKLLKNGQSSHPRSGISVDVIIRLRSSHVSLWLN